MPNIEVVQRNIGHHLEGPHWEDVTGTLLYVSILGRTIHRYNPKTGEVHEVNVGERVGAVVPTRSGRTLVAAGHRIGYVNWETGDLENIVEVEKEKNDTRFNDAKCDPVGRFWAGTMGFEDAPSGPDEKATPGKGALYCFHPDGKFVTHLQKVDISNGLAWTADHKTMYYIDSLRYGVDAFDYNVETGEIANRRRVINIPEAEGFPDGMCIDKEGKLWVAHFNGAAVKRYDPQTGKRIQTVQLPCDVITSCCWGGDSLDELYVTSSKLYLSDEQLKMQDDAGSVLRVTGLGVQGVKGVAFDDTKWNAGH